MKKSNSRQRSNSLIRRRLFVECLEPRQLLAADFQLVKDIDTAPSTASSDPKNIVEVNGVGFFAASTLTTGAELWKSDGTAAGTVQMKDIFVGTASSNLSYLTNVNGILFFRARDEVSGYELWKSDGTAAGTVQVKDIRAGIFNSYPRSLTNVNGTLYFSALSVQGDELWKSDGTAAGTVRVKSIVPGIESSSPGNLTNVGGTLFFTATDTGGGAELWKSDGTDAGTVQVKDINPGTFDSAPTNLTNVNGILFFSANNAVGGIELWKSDGTAAGTVQVKDILAGATSSNPRNLTNVNGTLFFSATDVADGEELWKSDGTAMGTVQVKDINAGTLGSSPTQLTNVDGTLYFSANDAARGTELWKSNGTSGGTVRVKDINAGASSSTPRSLANMNGTLYFSAMTIAGGVELWKSDGTAVGTVQLKDIFAGTSSSSPVNLTNVNGTLIFGATDAAGGLEIWKSNGTDAGTVQVKDINAGTSSSASTNLTNVNGTLYFNATTVAGGSELWKSDGTAAGTVQVKDINAGSISSNPRMLTNVNGTLYFRATDTVSGSELWKSDGTAAGTVQVKDIFIGTFESNIRDMTNMSGTLFFAATSVDGGPELWKSDGTNAGTVQVKDIVAGAPGSIPSSLTNVNGTLYFSAFDTAGGSELWKSDGTTAGTIQVKDIFAGSTGSNPRYLTNVSGTLYFVATDAAGGEELWKSDGTAAGTVQVKDINPGASRSFPSRLTNVNGTLYFRATDGVNGVELWKSNGTAAGTVLVKDIRPGSSSSLYYLTNVNGTLYFRAQDAVGGAELWKSDGTETGTVQVKDIRVGTLSSSPSSLANVNGTLYFVASDGVTGNEVWKSDGTAASTVLVSDIAVTGGSEPSGFTLVDNLLFVSAVTDQLGRELYALSFNAPTDLSLSSRSIAENQSIGATVGSFSTTDPNATDTHTYQFVSGAGDVDNSRFSIVGNTLFTNASFNFEVQNHFSIRVRTTDQEGLWLEKTLSIEVTNVNETPTFSQSSYPFRINSRALLGATVGIATATDLDAGNTLTYSIVDGDSLGAFAINPSTGRITIRNPNKLPKIVSPATSVTAPVLTIQVSDGSLVDVATVTVTLNLAPLAMSPIAAAKTQSFQIRENNAIGATVATLTGTPAYTGQFMSNWTVSDNPGGPASSRFYVKSSTASGAVIGANARLSFENQSSYILYVTVSDSLDSTKTVTTPVTINITNVNDAPQLSLTNGLAGSPIFTSGTPTALVAKYRINEFTITTAGSTPKNGDVLFTLNAQDDDQASSSLVYAMTGAGVTNPSSGVFVDKTGAIMFIVATGKVMVLDTSKLDYEKFKTGVPLAFTVADNGLPGATPRVLTSKATVTLLLNDLNDAPTFVTQAPTVVKAENNLANALVFKTAATDGDTLDGVTQPLTYSLLSAIDGTGANVTSKFSIHPTTGEIRVIAANQFNFEVAANRTFRLIVRANESGASGLTTAQSALGDQFITLNITDVNERPSAVFTPVNGSPIAGSTGSVTINLAGVSVGSTIGSLAITDPDILAALATYGPNSIVVTVLDNSSTTAPALRYRANTNPTTGGSLQVNNLATLQSKVGSSFTVRFTIKDKSGLAGALSFTLSLTIRVTN